MKTSLRSLAALALLGITGCGAQAPVGDSPSAHTLFEASHVKAYSSINELMRDSTAVVVVTALAGASRLASDEEGQSELSATVTHVRVDRLLWGNLEGESTLFNRQLGNSSPEMSGVRPYSEASTHYALFITPFEFREGVSTGQYLVTGDSAEYLDDGGSCTLLSKEVGEQIPRILTEKELAAALLSPDR